MTQRKTDKSRQTKKVKSTSEPIAEKADAIAERENAAFPVVGIGASAGGLAAFEAFFSGMPADRDTGMAFVLVQHLAPDHKSILAELVKRYTRMEVFEVQDGMKVAPNCAYIIPPNHDMALLNGSLQLLEPTAERGHRLPIDFFFRSLAQDQHERAVCIILSGTGSDGALGAREVKGAGGLVMVQSPESTEFDGMPRSAIATGLVDSVLAPAEMPAQLLAYIGHAFGPQPKPSESLLPKAEHLLNKVFLVLRTQTGHDFSQYKQNTICRRIERRMAVQQIEQLSEYVSFLQQTPAEVEALFRDLLIGVTHFFRDPEAFDVLAKEVLAKLFEEKAVGTPIRIWVPGCSTGEEAYSIAILMREQAEARKSAHGIQIFATDIDSRAIATARTGLYPASIANDITQERLERFFSSEQGGNYRRAHKIIRDMIVFSEQDLVKDPPFSRLDLISCRNLMIYMGPELQKKVIPLFHYALNPGGALFVGTAESVGEFTNRFTATDRKWKIYRSTKSSDDRARSIVPMIVSPLGRAASGVAAPRALRSDVRIALRNLLEVTLLREQTPAAALVDEQGEILYLHGRTGRFLEPAAGDPAMNILKMAREGLRRDLATALHRAASHQEVARCAGLRVKTNGDFTLVDLSVQPLPFAAEHGVEQKCFLVVLRDTPVPTGAQAASPAQEPAQDGRDAVDPRIAQLEKELRSKEEYLQSAIEEMETANEELKSSNGELQSTNEELQSTNEELETSKEELQSLNEELSTVNAELQTKLVDLSRANNDMNNLLAGTGIGTVYLDLNLRIQRFTPAITQIIHLIQTDIGRPVGHIVSNLDGYADLVADVQGVLDTLVPREIEVKTQEGAWYLLRIRPYRTLENVIEGVVITFTDITELKHARAVLQDSETLRRLAVVVRDAEDAITMIDMDGRILAWNPGAERLYGWSEAEALAKNLSEMLPKDLRSGALSKIMQLASRDSLIAESIERIGKDGGVVKASILATLLVDEQGKPYAIATTERKGGVTRRATDAKGVE